MGDIAYTVTNWGGLIILNVRDPRAPVLLGYRGLQGGGHSVAVRGKLAYSVSENGGLRIIDVSDLTNPVEIGSYWVPGVARAVAVAGMAGQKTVAYVAAGPAGLVAIDVSDPGHPVPLSRNRHPRRCLECDPGRPHRLHRGLGGGVRVMDITDPWHPVESLPIPVYDTAADVEVGMLTPGGAPRAPYAAEGYAGLVVIDLCRARPADHRQL